MGMPKRPGLTDEEFAQLNKRLRDEGEAGALTPARRARIIADFARHPDHPVQSGVIERILDPVWDDEQIQAYRRWYERLTDDGDKAAFVSARIKSSRVSREYAIKMLTGEYESPEQRKIAELERQLADARAVSGIKPKRRRASRAATGNEVKTDDTPDIAARG